MTIYDRAVAGLLAPGAAENRVDARRRGDRAAASSRGACWPSRSSTRYPFSLGVASGDPLPDGIVLWTRLAPKPLEGGGMPMNIVDVDWEIARDARFQNVVQKGTALARPELGHSVHVEVGGLEPAREYWYRFHAGDEVEPDRPDQDRAGRRRCRSIACASPSAAASTTRTATSPRSGGSPKSSSTSSSTPATTSTKGAPTAAGTDRRFRQHNGDEVYTLGDYRNRYALYKSDRDLMAAHASAPWVVTWDDHEVDNNYAGDIDENDTPPEIFVLRRAAAYQAYYEAMPLRASALPSGSHMRIYRRLQFGNLIDLSVLDTRQWRSDQPCGDGSRTNCAARLAPTQTMMGAEQEKWLFDNLGTVKARWTVIGQQVYSFAYDRSKANPDGQFSMDKWDGYVAARQRLYHRLLETHAPNPIVLSGDVHQHYGADLKMDFTDPAIGDGRHRVHQHGGHAPPATAATSAATGKRRRPTTRTSSTTATAAATSPAPRRRRRCAPTSRSSTR